MKNIDINKLIATLTIEEKVGQLVQLTADHFIGEAEITGPYAKYNLSDEQKYYAGSIIGAPDATNAYEIQKTYLEKSNHKIPLLFMADVIHGSHSIFPVPLGAASSFNPKLINDIAKYSSIEAANTGVQVTFSPMADLARDARWGRNMESNGEDPYLNKVLTSEYVKGYQGNQLDSNSTLVSCVKHFAGYGMVESGREYNYSDLSERVLNEMHYPSYKAAIDSGAGMVMSAFNTIDCIPATVNRKLLTDDLRGKLGFDGIVISDWGAVTETINHKLADSFEGCAKLAVDAGIDIDMMSFAYILELVELVKKGEIEESRIDELVYNVIKIKKDYGLFENPYKNLDPKKDKEIGLKTVLDKTKEVADESIVLLKNDGMLPLKDEKYCIYGRKVDSKDYMGPWSWQGKTEYISSIKDVFAKDENCQIIDYNGANFEQQIFDHSKKIVLFMGENSWESGEAKSKTNIKLKIEEIDIIKRLKMAGKEITLVVFAGRPLDLSDVDMLCDSIIYAWFPGSRAAEALYDIITGVVNPSGKLAMSLPKSVGQCPIYYNNYPTGRPYEKAEEAYVTKYIDESHYPLYSFGHGLSYSDVVIKEVQMSETKGLNDNLELTVVVENESNIAGKEVLQVYLNDLVASVVRPRKELKAFTKFEIGAGETKIINITVDSKEFGYINQNIEHTIDKGKFEVMVGFNSEDIETKIVEIV